MDLLYKPCINNCGHTFCFWCMHNSMNPFRPSQCPLCRAAYTHFPRVCVPLHYFLASSFPEQYSERERENRGKVKRPYRCSNPSCGRLAYQPCILSCGCVVCRSCLPGTPRASRGTRAQGAAVAAVAAAAGHLITSPTGPGASPPPQQQQQRSSREHPEQQQQQQQGVCGQLDPDTDGLGKLPRTLPRREGSASPPASPPRQRQPGRQEKMEDEGYHHDQQPRQQHQEQGRRLEQQPTEQQQQQQPKQEQHLKPQCPSCGRSYIPGPQVCGKLEEALRCLYPDTYKQRQEEEEEEEELRAAAAAAPAAVTATTDIAAAAAASSARNGEAEGSKLPRIDALIAAAAIGAAAAGRGADGTSLSSSAASHPSAPPPPPPSIIDIWLALREEMAAQADTCFTWYSIQCVECTEVVGYDLCGACYDRGAAGRGRFNQLHRPEHRVVKVEPCFGQVTQAEARRGGAAATASAAGGAAASEPAASASASAAERVDGGGDGDRPGVAVLEGLQLLTLMNYLEVLHPELTVEQATTLVIMHLGAPGGLLDLAEAGLRGGGGGGGGGAVGRGGARGAPAARSSRTNVAGGTSSSSSSSVAAGSRGFNFRWGSWSFSFGRSDGGTGGAGDGAADAAAAASGTVVDGSGGRRFGGDGGGGSGLPWFAWASRRRGGGGGGGDAGLSSRQRAFTGPQDVERFVDSSGAGCSAESAAVDAI
ncbi:hypothetical protein VOLCADRAFT_100003 [Volvox carteri f. nagariensis]|uniref:RING-type domain-containing protein n=1 Tax=Volvox carteri f. nagariensis TaxID=3068 RepID=D8UJ59_VOLCA|nr:uncharacterized protein VOLCADRAFT_100003 [Volvox carteri f. nagariensis]EFJ40214.1 hypothetical protein VOLCADRAFT_100003 [Volvox carteri f. nagariensis]|eukprot:XP_002958694.1 hypothetical protein VOLCADRAFT_100003 [Volvox carteri f. nagariensis]